MKEKIKIICCFIAIYFSLCEYLLAKMIRHLVGLPGTVIKKLKK